MSRAKRRRANLHLANDAGGLDGPLIDGVRDIEHWDKELGLIGRHPAQVVIRMGWRLEDQRQEITKLKEEIASLKAKLDSIAAADAPRPGTLVWRAVMDGSTCRACAYRDGREIGEGKCDEPPNRRCSSAEGKCRCVAVEAGKEGAES